MVELEAVILELYVEGVAIKGKSVRYEVCTAVKIPGRDSTPCFILPVMYLCTPPRPSDFTVKMQATWSFEMLCPATILHGLHGVTVQKTTH
jgi:hypothetical protein